MGYIAAMFVLSLVAVSQAKSVNFFFGGLFTGYCGPDGYYYEDADTFVQCSGGRAYHQKCALGTQNSPLEFYETGFYKQVTVFCDMNLNDAYNAMRVGQNINIYNENENMTDSMDTADAAVEYPVGETPVGETPAEGTLAEGTPVEGIPAEGTPADGTPAEGTPVEGTPAEQTPVDERPAGQRPGYERPAGQRPGYESPAEQRPGYERPAEQRPGYERPAGQRPGYERPAEQRPGYESSDEEAPVDNDASAANGATTADEAPAESEQGVDDAMSNSEETEGKVTSNGLPQFYKPNYYPYFAHYYPYFHFPQYKSYAADSKKEKSTMMYPPFYMHGYPYYQQYENNM